MSTTLTIAANTLKLHSATLPSEVVKLLEETIVRESMSLVIGFLSATPSASEGTWLHMSAKYYGKCACCGAKLVPGQSIAWHKASKQAVSGHCYSWLRSATSRGALRNGKLVARPMAADSRGNSHCA